MQIENTIDYKIQLDDTILTFIKNLPGKHLAVAAFDLDSTLIRPLTGKSNFDHDPDNWQWFTPNVITTLQQIAERGYQIVIITNQGGHSVNRLVKEGNSHPLIIKFINILEQLSNNGIFAYIYACVGRSNSKTDIYRKPAIGMWRQIICRFGQPIKAFYVGDAAGRPGDHSDSDLLFSQNANIDFYLPEEIFTKTSDNLVYIKTDKPTLVILVGYPASGKSTYIKKHSSHLAIVSQDVFKSGRRTSRKLSEVIQDTRKLLELGNSIVVDRTNMSKQDRALFIELAKTFGIETVCIFLDVDLDESYRRNILRSETNQTCPKIHRIVYYTMRKKFTKPDESEGCTVIEINPPNINKCKLKSILCDWVGPDLQ